jgi:flagellar assembly protein FliH
MMPLRLEVFETDPPLRAPGNPAAAEAVLAEEARLAAYDQGYAAGWEDAVAAHRSEETEGRLAAARALQALGFTFQEARAHVLRAVEPLLQEMVAQLLPAMAREALAPVVLETLMPLAEELGDAPITLVCNPAVRETIVSLLDQATGLPVTVTEEPSLPEGQVYLRLGTAETRVDLARATAEIAAAVRGFFDLSEQQERRHG